MAATIDALFLEVIVAALTDRNLDGQIIQKLKDLADGQAQFAGAVMNALGGIEAAQAKMQSDIDAIKAFLTVSPGAISAADQATLDAHKQRILELEKQLESINTQPPQ